MTTSTYTLTGLCSASGMAELIERLSLLPGVSQVSVDLGRHGPSLLVLQGAAKPSEAQIRSHLRPAGVRLTGTESAGLPSSGDLHTNSAGPSFAAGNVGIKTKRLPRGAATRSSALTKEES